jgi:hypothetical protein
MAKLTTAKNETVTNNRADAFLNLRIIDKNGVAHSFKTGIALYNNRRLDTMVMEGKLDLESLMAEGRIQMSVFVVGNNSEELEF